jgi:hypothetical protein
VLALIIWLGGYMFMYAWRLPVTYQHGRYVMPMMPVFFIFGFVGFTDWALRENPNKLQWVITKAWSGIVLIVTAIFWVLGGWAYARDVAVIESEMVSVAHWLNLNTSEDSIIAVHDIGAIGYFGNHDLLDLAGLISPDVISFIRDEDQLGKYLDTQGAEYLVTFPGWYPTLVGRASLIFQVGSPISPSLGGENMAVYKWTSP